ncbi:hypothetical protein PsorP6_006266 [Peronosclerospora sorghi]|uniref:Uncharacterized protein n=1 Tax=Peronosclerospora sorghi TaxID=230839 RepID=A0ACC0W1Q5_9STRA|nr:hypothetical protein PsorP6_006266 [Peronosclerospora sorghi]
MVGDGVQDDDNLGVPDPKRLRLIERYEIALAVMEITRTYKEAMASPHADKWNEAVCRKLRTHMVVLMAFELFYVIRQLDVETAYFNDNLKEDVYMYLPDGIYLEDDMCCKLRRSIYGLKQAAAVWHETIKSVPKKTNFRQ